MNFGKEYRMTKRPVFLAIMLLAAFGLSACGSTPDGVTTEAKYPTGLNRSTTNGDIYAKPKSVLGSDGLNLFGGKKSATSDVITVNSYLWRAALDTVNFMPLASVDPFGGVILTDWYSDASTPNERYKLNIFVMGGQLRSDGIKVSMFKERKAGAGWANVAVASSSNTEIEDAILTRARELRVAARDANQK